MEIRNSFELYLWPRFTTEVAMTESGITVTSGKNSVFTKWEDVTRSTISEAEGSSMKATFVNLWVEKKHIVSVCVERNTGGPVMENPELFLKLIKKYTKPNYSLPRSYVFTPVEWKIQSFVSLLGLLAAACVAAALVYFVIR